MKKIKRGMSSETNTFTPEQLKQLRKVAKTEDIPKKDIVKTFTKTTNVYPLRGVYLLEYEDGIKIGMSKNIKDRLKTFDKPWCKPILRKMFFYCEFFQDLEIEVLKKSKQYIDFTVNSNEWITGIDFDNMVNNIDKIATIRDCQNQTFKNFIESNL